MQAAHQSLKSRHEAPSRHRPLHALPIGIQAFSKLREEGCCYVEKTALAIQLIQSGNRYFISLPWRFGKSLHQQLTMLAQSLWGRVQQSHSQHRRLRG